MKGVSKILVTFPTEGEARPFLTKLGYRAGQWEGIVNLGTQTLEISIAITGIGMVATAYQLGRILNTRQWDWAFQGGIAGTFDPQIAIGTVGQIREDCFPELGASSPEGFLDLSKLGFPSLHAGGKDFFNVLQNPHPAFSGFPQWKGVTVNTVSGTADQILFLEQNWSPVVESMETAAFFHACLASEVSFTAIRAISNRVEPRDTSKWQIGVAVEALANGLIEALSQIAHEN